MQIINMIMIYYWDKKLKKRLPVLEADIITITPHQKKNKKNIDLMSLAQRIYFLPDGFQMIAIVLVINHYYINGLHLFWDTLYKHLPYFVTKQTMCF